LFHVLAGSVFFAFSGRSLVSTLSGSGLAGVDNVSMDFGHSNALNEDPSGPLDASAPHINRSTRVHNEVASSNVCTGHFTAEVISSSEVLRMRGSTSRAQMHAHHASCGAHVAPHAAAVAATSASGTATADNSLSVTWRLDECEQDSTQSIAASSVIQALHELAEQLRMDISAAPVEGGQHNIQHSMHNLQSVQENQQNCKDAVADGADCSGAPHALAVEWTPSVGSTNSGPFNSNNQGVATRGVVGKACQGNTWRGKRDVTDSYLIHAQHACRDWQTVELGAHSTGAFEGNLQEVECDRVCEEATCMQMTLMK
jgi:hypothetical protein